MKIKINVPLEYGILFLYDPYGDPELPEDTGAAPITFTSSAICFQVSAYVDGDTDVTISDQPLSGNALPEFSQEICCPKKYISLADTTGNYYCILPVKIDSVRINIWAYGTGNDERTWVQVCNLDLF